MDIQRIERELRKAEKAAERAMRARTPLPPGSSRARVTSANARWAAAAEAKGVDAIHILHRYCKDDHVSVRWYADKHNAHAEVRELVEAFEALWRATNAEEFSRSP